MDEHRERTGFFDQYWRTIIETCTPAIAHHRVAERQLAERLIADGGYRTVIEGGCADGSLLLDAVLGRGLGYVGVDLAGEAVELAARRLATSSPGSDQIVRLTVDDDIREADRLVLRYGIPTDGLLVALPFNVLGNIPSPDRVFAAAARCPADVLVLTFDTTPAAAQVRADYYRACGFRGRLVRDERGVHFAAGLFTSSVYHPAVVEGWLTAAGYAVHTERYGTAGIAYLGCRSRAPARAADRQPTGGGEPPAGRSRPAPAGRRPPRTAPRPPSG